MKGLRRLILEWEKFDYAFLIKRKRIVRNQTSRRAREGEK